METPGCRGLVFIALREATLELWGAEGLKAVGALMPPEVRAEVIDGAVFAGTFFPETHIMAWMEAIWTYRKHSEADVRKVTALMMDYGFGRVRKLMMKMI